MQHYLCKSKRTERPVVKCGKVKYMHQGVALTIWCVLQRPQRLGGVVSSLLQEAIVLLEQRILRRQRRILRGQSMFLFGGCLQVGPTLLVAKSRLRNGARVHLR